MHQPNATTKKTKTTTRSTTEVRAALMLVATLLLPAACGGGAQSEAVEPVLPRHSMRVDRRAGAPGTVPVRPILVTVNPKRSGGSLEVGIEVIGRGHGEGEAFEDTAGWSIVAVDHRGQELRRIMNGPGHVERAPVGVEDGSQWDVTVKGTVFFALPKDVQHVAVRVAVPQAQPVEIQSEVR
jgi:hypothetical protein